MPLGRHVIVAETGMPSCFNTSISARSTTSTGGAWVCGEPGGVACSPAGELPPAPRIRRLRLVHHEHHDHGGDHGDQDSG